MAVGTGNQGFWDLILPYLKSGGGGQGGLLQWLSQMFSQQAATGMPAYTYSNQQKWGRYNPLAGGYQNYTGAGTTGGTDKVNQFIRWVQQVGPTGKGRYNPVTGTYQNYPSNWQAAAGTTAAGGGTAKPNVPTDPNEVAEWVGRMWPQLKGLSADELNAFAVLVSQIGAPPGWESPESLIQWAQINNQQKQQEWQNQFSQAEADRAWAQWGEQSGLSRDQFNEQIRQFNEQANQWKQQFGANQGQQQWQNQFTQAEADRAYQQWGAQMGLSRDQFNEAIRQFNIQNTQQQGQQQWQNQFTQAEADRAYEEWGKQYGLTKDQFMESIRQYNQSLAESQRQFNVGMTEQQRQAAVAQGQWGQQFAAQQAAAQKENEQWQKQYEEQQRQWSGQYNLQAQSLETQTAAEKWNRAMQEAQFKWQQQRALEQDKLQKELASMTTFGRRFNPNYGAM